MPLSGGGAGGGLIFVDRGDPAAVDLDKDDVTIDGAYHDLDLSGIITDSDAVIVEFRMIIRDAQAAGAFTIRAKGNSNSVNIAREYAYVANEAVEGANWCPLDEDLKCEYTITAGVDEIWFVVRGWWKPA